jgi:hypothetical protein
MLKIFRVVAITVGVVLLAWVIKEMFGDNAAKKSESLVEKIRMNGVA